MNQQLMNGAAELGLTLSDQQQQALLDYFDLLKKWNRVYNLTAIEAPNEIIDKHFLDSLSVAPYLKTAKRVLDVGTGAGFPGIPLAIYYQEISFVLLDSNSKKTRFLQQVLATLGLKNVRVIHSRIEDFTDQSGFDVIISRAFSSLNDMIAHTWRYLSDTGELLAMKGQVPDETLAECYQSEVIKLTVPGQKSRHLVIVRNSDS